MTELQRQYRKEIGELAEASVRIAELGYVASQGGNLSYRVADDVVLITPTKVAKRRVTFDDICIIRLNCEVLYAKEGAGRPARRPYIRTSLKRGRTCAHSFMRIRPC